MLLRRLRNLVTLLGPVQAMRFLLARAIGTEVLLLRPRGAGRALRCRPADSDVQCMWQVFGRRDCGVDMDPPPRVVLDGGANVGYSTVYYAGRFPGAVVIAVEPDRANVEMIEFNCRGLDNVRILRAALWSGAGMLKLESPKGKSWSMRTRPPASSEAADVEALTIAGALARAGEASADLVKLDIEGAEEAVFAARDLGWLDGVRGLIVEVHSEHAEEIVDRAMSARAFQRSVQGEKRVYTRTSGEGV